jgi:hypothetical protein
MWLLTLAWASLRYCLSVDDDELRRRQLERLDHMDRVLDRQKQEGGRT